MNFIVLTGKGGVKTRINFDLISEYSSDEKLTRLRTANGYYFYVKETPEEIDKFIGLVLKTNNLSDKKYTEDISKEYFDELK